MKVFKFGGASIKDYKSIIRLSRIIRKENHDRMILIVSAMGKTTNSMEKIVLSYLNSFKNFNDKLELIKNFHLDGALLFANFLGFVWAINLLGVKL